jgi:hypothetical protein
MPLARDIQIFIARLTTLNNYRLFPEFNLTADEYEIKYNPSPPPAFVASESPFPVGVSLRSEVVNVTRYGAEATEKGIARAGLVGFKAQVRNGAEDMADCKTRGFHPGQARYTGAP